MEILVYVTEEDLWVNLFLIILVNHVIDNFERYI